MLNDLIIIISMYGLSFILKDSDIFSGIRNLLMRNKYCGIFFYGLFSCYACVGFWSGIIIFGLYISNIIYLKMLIWGFAGTAISFVLNNFVSKLNNK